MTKAPPSEVDNLRTRMLTIGEELLAALSRENQINESRRLYDLQKARMARLNVDRLTEEYSWAIDEYRDAMHWAIQSAINRRGH